MTKRDIKYIVIFAAIGLLIVTFGLLRVEFGFLQEESIDLVLWVLGGPVSLSVVYISLGDITASILFVVYYCFLGLLISRLLLLKRKSLKICLIFALIVLQAYIGYSASEIFKQKLTRALESLVK